MGSIKILGATAFRDYETAGVPASGIHPVVKSDVREVFAQIDAQIGALTGNQGEGFLAFDTLANLSADLGHPANTGAAVYNDTFANNGIYRKVGASGSGSWSRLAPLQGSASDRDFATLQTLGNDIVQPGAVPVLTSGLPGQFPRGFSSTFCGWATPITSAGQSFDCARFWYSIEEPGHLMRIGIWKAAPLPVLIAQADVIPYKASGFIDVRFPLTVAPAGTIWGSMHIPNGETRLQGFVPPVLSNVSAAVQLYCTTAAPSENLVLWNQVVDNSIPIAFALYNSRIVSSRWSADSLAIAPRLYGTVGLQTNVYFDNLRSGQSLRVWDANSAAGNGRQDDERYTVTPAADIVADSISITVQEPDTLQILGVGQYKLDAATMSAAGGASRRFLMIGDSLTALARYLKRLRDLSVANSSAVQVTLMGTKIGDIGVSTPEVVTDTAIKHEGRAGWTVGLFYQPVGSGPIADNPFTDHVAGHKFNAAGYLSNTAQAAPNVVGWCLGINDVFGLTTDAAVNAAMDTYISQLDQMIGRVDAADVGSWWEVTEYLPQLICLPPAPAFHQDAFGANYGTTQYRARYRRNINIAWARIIESYSGLESQKIFLVPFNAVVDPDRGYPYGAAAPANSHTPTNVQRQTNAVHPYTAGEGGFDQMGDQLFSAINTLVVRGLI